MLQQAQQLYEQQKQPQWAVYAKQLAQRAALRMNQ
jgi:hypothetical protein